MRSSHIRINIPKIIVEAIYIDHYMGNTLHMGFNFDRKFFPKTPSYWPFFLRSTPQRWRYIFVNSNLPCTGYYSVETSHTVMIVVIMNSRLQQHKRRTMHRRLHFTNIVRRYPSNHHYVVILYILCTYIYERQCFMTKKKK